MTFSINVFSISNTHYKRHLAIMKFGIKDKAQMIVSTMTLSIMTLSIMTLSTMTIYAYAECHYAESLLC